MNILYILRYWPGLFESHTCREIDWLKKRGHRFAIASLGITGPYVFKEESERYVDLSGYDLEDVPVLRLESRRMSKEEVIAEILSFARRNRSELIHADFAREPAEMALDAHLAVGIPFTVRMIGGDVHSTTSPRLPEIVEHAAAMYPVSRFLADILIGKKRLKKSPSGIPIDVSSMRLQVLPYSLPTRYLSDGPVRQCNDTQVVGSIGRLAPVKRLHDLLEAAAGLAGEFPGLRLLIIGGGVLASDLCALAKKLGIADRFQITGFRSWEDVMALAARLHIFVHASELEGCSVTTIEAAFKGLPLVLSGIGTAEECVEPGVNGYLFDPGDVQALQGGLRSLLLAGARKREEMGAASMEIVGRRFAEDRQMPKMEAILQSAIDGSCCLHSKRLSGASPESSDRSQIMIKDFPRQRQHHE